MGRKIFGVYLLLAFVFALYGNWWGDYAYKGLAYNMGRGLIWPAILFPSLGAVVGGLIMLAFVGYFIFSKRPAP